MDIVPILAVLVFMAGVMTAAWLTQRAANNSGWIDVFWTLGTGASGVLVALWPGPGDVGRKLLAAALLALWSVRLAVYVARRVMASQTEDARYAGFRRDWGPGYQSRIFWLTLPQAAVTALLAVSIQQAVLRPQAGLDLRDLLAALVLLVAIGGETLADAQMARFKRGHPPKGSINREGLWGWSRHPNYFFEWLGWWAWPVMALRLDQPLTLLTLLAPAAMYVVLRYVTGVPPLEASMRESRGEAFDAYARAVSIFIPLPPKEPRP